MGNSLIDHKGRLNQMKSFETHNTEQDIGVRQKRLSDNKLFKTMHYKMHHQNLIVKVHLILKQLTHFELYTHYQNFQYLIEKLEPYPNLMAFRGLINFGKLEKPSPQEMQNECNKDYLAVSRQIDCKSNYKLPKCLLNFYTLQLLSAVKTLHQQNLYHGHIRSSNILLTSLDYLVLTDFASYKPYYSNKLEIIRNVYESSIQKCTLAPEKYAETQDIQYIPNLTKQQINDLQKMDMFSVGCVIYEIYTGENLFTFNQLLQYLKPDQEPLISVEDLVGDLICNLIEKDPNKRFTAEQAFNQFQDQICADEIFELLQKVCYAINFKGEFMHPDIRIQLFRQIISLTQSKQWNYVMPIPLQFVPLDAFNEIEVESISPNKRTKIQFNTPPSSEILAGQIENCENLIAKDQNNNQNSEDQLKSKGNLRGSPNVSELICWKSKQFDRKSLLESVKTNNNQRQNEYIIFILWIFNSMRNCRFLQTRLCGLELVEYLLGFIDDSSMYKLIIPNLGQFSEDYEGQTQYYAFSILLDLLKRLNYPHNCQTEALIFKLYIWEQIKTRMQDMNQNPMLALKIGDIAEVLHIFNRAEEKNLFIQIIQKKLQDENQEQCILLIQNIKNVLQYYDQFQTIEIMKLLIAQLNKIHLKIPLLEVGFDLLQYYAQTDMKKTLLTCLQLNTRHELALFRTLRIITKASENQLLELDKIKQFIKEISPLVLHHNRWVREEAQKFIIIQLRNFNSLENYLHLLPYIKKYLKQDVPHLNEEVFSFLVQKPASQSLFMSKNQEFSNFQPSSEREQYNYNNYQQEYILKSKPNQEISAQKQNNKQVLPITMIKRRFDEFFDAACRIKLLKQGSFHIFQDFIANERALEDQSNFSNGNFGIYLKKFEQYENFKKKHLVQQSFKSSTQCINYLNFHIIFNSFIQKSYQLHKPELKFQRSIQPKIVRQFKIRNQLVTTISEHDDIVTSLQKHSDQRRFISGSHDGTIRFFDMNKIQEDFTSGSILQIPIKNEQRQIEKVTALRFLEGTESFIVGTNSGQVSQYRADLRVTTFPQADSGIRRIVDYDNAFCYVTEKGSLVLEDIRSRSSQYLGVNKKCGLATSLIHDNYKTLLSTLNGYLILYDNRCMMLMNIYQLVSKNDQPLPIFNMCEMNRNSLLEGINSNSDKLVGIGYQSLHNEVAFFDIKMNRNSINPSLFLHCSQNKNVQMEMPKLKSVLNVEQIVNEVNRIATYTQSNDQTIQKFNLNFSSLFVKEQLLQNMWKNYLDCSFQDTTNVTSMLCLSGRGYNQKLENTIITASKDRSVQSWTLNSDVNNSELEFQTNVICSPYNSNRKYKQYMKGDVLIIEDHEIRNAPNISHFIEHQDSITDMIYLDSENSYLLTASKDNTIKIWK
ncbi:unnamed protein product (macronuclear) [Paramecium tetraurelia]|uniref:non-specific serine/threonine protein kinase n=1 Tax=Paramecium tetraurelia TaxID=5888 RepID=A0EG91_PARTE|nr:uncharacterized protein GSPATT00026656001 [Paramecium tetraurelia]CAK94332.1 unnamed protein product [Paramecium tetraurelia]|eukprot:XP_001461705.1 hypothetical protein (macronuclear) [Paramecium tetraurelia strain d4-2]